MGGRMSRRARDNGNDSTEPSHAEAPSPSNHEPPSGYGAISAGPSVNGSQRDGSQSSSNTPFYRRWRGREGSSTSSPHPESEPLLAEAHTAGRARGREGRNAYTSLGVRISYGITALLFALSLISLVLLILSLFLDMSPFLPPSRSPGLLPLWYALLSSLMALENNLLFETTSTATRGALSVACAFIIVQGVFLFSVSELRTTESWLGLGTCVLAFVTAAWYLVSECCLARKRLLYRLPTSGRLAAVPLPETQPKWERRCKTTLSVLFMTVVNLVLLGMTFDIALRAFDLAEGSRGERVWVRLKGEEVGRWVQGRREWVDLDMEHFNNSTVNPDLDTLGGNLADFIGPIEAVYPPLPPFRIHLFCHGPTKLPKPGAQGVKDVEVPTVLVETEQGVPGQVGAKWVEELREEGKIGKVCWWDRPGYAHSDPTYSASLPFLHLTLLHALSAHPNGTVTGPFVHVSHGFGYLLSFLHASLLRPSPSSSPAETFHAALLVDPDTPGTWFADPRAKRSLLGLFLKDVLPPVLEPLGLIRAIGVALGYGRRERILGKGAWQWARVRGRGERDDRSVRQRLLDAGGSTPSHLRAALWERLDRQQPADVSDPRAQSFRALEAARPLYPASRPHIVMSSQERLRKDEVRRKEQRWLAKEFLGKNGGLRKWDVIGRGGGGGGEEEGEDGWGDGPMGICEKGEGRKKCQDALVELVWSGSEDAGQV